MPLRIPMTFRFNFEKTLQAAAVLLGLDGNRMDRIRLLKLLYIADRELLAQCGRTLTGDRAVALKNGPVLSHVYDLIRGEAFKAGDWDRYVHTVNHAIELREDPGRGELSRREVEKLKEVTERYRDRDDWEIVEETHAFPEWVEHYVEGSSTPIPWNAVLIAQGKPDLIPIIEQNEADRLYFDQVLGS
jgi:uncharacterized phage-associated protein